MLWTVFLQATFGPTTESDFVEKQVAITFRGGLISTIIDSNLRHDLGVVPVKNVRRSKEDLPRRRDQL